ncbi:MAG: hypothetical protein EHM12_08765 [Dehalococcoidia bacterium]|nr:MAG: hypothetical protein EHM12_08765 [Dehalococcoidia bacterium]
MQKIKFSHRYFKLPSGIREAILVNAVKVRLEDLPKEFIEYDTAYPLEGGKTGYYPLPKEGDYILLLFLGLDKLFTTLRPHNNDKMQYYLALEGETLEVVIDG